MSTKLPLKSALILMAMMATQTSSASAKWYKDPCPTIVSKDCSLTNKGTFKETVSCRQHDWQGDLSTSTTIDEQTTFKLNAIEYSNGVGSCQYYVYQNNAETSKILTIKNPDYTTKRNCSLKKKVPIEKSYFRCNFG